MLILMLIMVKLRRYNITKLASVEVEQCSPV